jgi:chromosome segregation ATPase
MSDPENSLILKILQNIQADVAGLKKDVTDIKQGVAGMKGNLSLLADGMVTLRRDMQEMTNAIFTLGVSVAGHAERLSDVEIRLERIEHRLETTHPV